MNRKTFVIALALLPFQASAASVSNPPKGCKKSKVEVFEDGSARVRCKGGRIYGYNPNNGNWHRDSWLEK